MAGKKAKRNGDLRAQLVVDVPLKEVSGICLRRDCNGRMSLLAVGDSAAVLAIARLKDDGSDDLDWQTFNISELAGSAIAEVDPQIEAIASDGAGHVLLLQESPPRAELIDLDSLRVVASIHLEVDSDSDLAASWSDPDGSHGEGVVLLPGGHLLVAKEKDPAALIEFGPPGSQSRGLSRGGALPFGAQWPIGNGEHRFVPLAVWKPDKILKKTCADFSDLEIGPDSHLYLLSDQSTSIARLDNLTAGGGIASLSASWQLEDLDEKPEGLSFTATGHAVVAVDKRKARNNLIQFEPSIAQPSPVMGVGQ